MRQNRDKIRYSFRKKHFRSYVIRKRIIDVLDSVYDELEQGKSLHDILIKKKIS